MPAIEPDGTKVRQRAYAAQAAGRLPQGMALTTQVRGNKITIRLIPASDVECIVPAAPSTISVPELPEALDPIARRFARYSERHEVSRGALERATKIVHAICTEARRRRWHVAAPKRKPRSNALNGRDYDVWQPDRDRHIVITATGVEFRIRVRENGVRTRGRHEDARERAERWGSLSFRGQSGPPGDYDDGGTGVLVLQLSGGRTFGARRRRSSWRDHGTRPIEHTLGELFAEIETRLIEETRAIEEHERREHARRERQSQLAAKREQQWSELMKHARRAYDRDKRLTYVSGLADRMADIQRLTDFVDACETEFGADTGTRELIAWMRTYLEASDPLHQPPRFPTIPDPTPSELAAHLPPGWNPHHP